MKKSSHPRPDTDRGGWIGVAVAIAVALLASFGAFGQERISVERHGASDGATVVFIPGLATPGEVFDPYVQTRADLDAHLFTLACFGGAPALDPADGVIQPAAEALAEYLQSSNLEDVVLVGHSLGGQVSLQAARRAPDKVRLVVVVDSLPFFAALMDPNADPATAQARGAAMASNMANMDRTGFLAMTQQGAPIQATSQAHQAQVVGYVAQSDQAMVVQGMYEALSLDWRDGLGEVRAPVTLLVPHNAFIGMSEEALGARYAAQYAAIEEVDVQIITDSRHFIMLDQPERFAEALATVLGEAS